MSWRREYGVDFSKIYCVHMRNSQRINKIIFKLYGKGLGVVQR